MGWSLQLPNPAASHDTIQTPVFLPPAYSGDGNIADIQLYSPTQDQSLGTLFQYPTRGKPDENLDRWWAKLREKKRYRHWAIENPFDLQRASMLLLQYEQLWYSGHAPKNDSRIANELDLILMADQTILPPVHSVYDAQEIAPIANMDFSEIRSGFSLEWLKAKLLDDEGKPIEETSLTSWREAIGAKDYRAAFEIWEAFANASNVKFDDALAAISDELNQFSNTKIGTPPLNEWVYLNRIKSEFPNNEYQDSHRLAVLASLKTRQHANRFFSQLNPVLLDVFEKDFTDLENERRNLEDGLFAFEAESGLRERDLQKEFRKRTAGYLSIQREHNALADSIARANQLLIEAPHAFRFALEIFSNDPNTNALDLSLLSDYNNAWQKLADIAVVNRENQAELQGAITRFDQLHKKMYRLTENDDMIAGANVKRYADLTKITTKDRNTNHRLLRFWPSRLSEVTDKSFDSTREYIRGILNASLVQKTGEVNVAEQSDSYSKLVAELSGNDDHLNFLRTAQNKENTVLLELTGKTLQRKSAANSHMFWPNFYSLENVKTVSDNIVKSINQLHYQKSDLQFDRIVRDFWGTDINGKPYLERALRDHEQWVYKALRAPVIKSFARNQWLKTSQDINPSSSEKRWSEELLEVVAGGKSVFSSPQNWRNNDKLPPENPYDELQNPIANETKVFRKFARDQFADGNKLQLSLRTSLKGKESQFTLTETQRLEDESVGWHYNKFQGEPFRRTIYLRGWKVLKVLPDYQPKESRSSIPVVLIPEKPKSSKIVLRYAGEKRQRTKVTFLIDCSLSMKNSSNPTAASMYKLKRQLIGVESLREDSVIAKLLAREDVNIDLMAFGATKKVKTKGGTLKLDRKENGDVQYLPSELEQSEFWAKVTKPISHQRRRIAFPGDGKDDWDILYFKKEQSFGNIVDAVEELQPAGETPLRAALYHALRRADEAAFRGPQYFVVLTDGIDRISSRIKNGQKINYKWETLTELIRSFRKKNQIAIFNFKPNPARKSSKESEAEYQEKLDKLEDFESLAFEKQRGGRLDDFLRKLFPKASVVGTYNSDDSLFNSRKLNSGNEQVEVNIAPQRIRQVTDNWKLAVKSEGKIVLDRPAKWPEKSASKILLTGNEELEYVYDPIGTLTLQGTLPSTGPKVIVQGQEIEFRQEPGSNGLLDDFNLYQDVIFDFWATTPNVLTPSPSFAFLQATSPTGQKIVFQDFNETSIVKQSNRRRLVFNKINEKLFRRLGFQGQTTLELNLQSPPRLNNEFWHLIEFDAKQFTFRDKTNDRDDFPQGRDVLLKDIIGDNDGRYRIFAKSDSSNGTAEFTFTVSRTDPRSKIPLDCWLIQLLDSQTLRRNHDIFQEVSFGFEPVIRTYHFDPNGNLEKIVHRFVFEHSQLDNFNRGKPGWFAIHKIEEEEPGFVTVTTDELSYD